MDSQSTARGDTDLHTWPGSWCAGRLRTLGPETHNGGCEGRWGDELGVPGLVDPEVLDQKDISLPLLLLRPLHWSSRSCSPRKWPTSDRFVGGCGSGGLDYCCCCSGGCGGGFRWRLPRSVGHCVQVIYWIAAVWAFVAACTCSRGALSCAAPWKHRRGEWCTPRIRGGLLWKPLLRIGIREK